MAEMKIEFDMDNAAFDETPATEAARILRKIATQVEDGRGYGRIMDINGNAIGSWEAEG